MFPQNVSINFQELRPSISSSFLFYIAFYDARKILDVHDFVVFSTVLSSSIYITQFFFEKERKGEREKKIHEWKELFSLQ